MSEQDASLASDAKLASTHAASKPRKLRRFSFLAFLAAVVVAGGGFWIAYAQHLDWTGGHGVAHEATAHDSESGGSRVSVRVVHPRHGGLERKTEMPGTIRAFEYAPLQAKVAGYLKALNVDRGDHVKKGQILIQIHVPELDGALIGAQAALKRAEAVEIQTQARVHTAEVGVHAAEAKRVQADAVLEASVANRHYRKQALDRISALATRDAVEAKLVDEESARYLAAVSEEHSAKAGIATADVQIAEAKAAVDQARADLGVSQAEIVVARANVEKAKIMLDYTTIAAPFDGVVTFRGDGVHPGAFIRAAVDSQAEPMLTVARVDKLRTIIDVPDRDVPYCNPGDPVSLRIDALGGRTFEGKISRVSDSEDLASRTMRAEVDLPNPEGILRDGMYGQAVISLEPPSNRMTIPATCLVEQDGAGKGIVLAVRDGTVKRLPIQIGRDDGLLVEVNGGLAEDDAVVLQPSAAIRDGSLVNVQDATTTPGAGSEGHSQVSTLLPPNPGREASPSEPT